MAVVADVHTDFAVLRVEDRISEVSGTEVVLLPESRRGMRNVVLAIFAEVRAVGVDDSGGVVVNARFFFLVEGDDDDHVVLLRVLLHQLRRRPVGDLLDGVVPPRVLLGTEIRTGEDLLHAEHLHAFPSGLIDVLQRAFDLRIANLLDVFFHVGGKRGLNESAFHDSGHFGLLILVGEQLTTSPLTGRQAEFAQHLRPGSSVADMLELRHEAEEADVRVVFGNAALQPANFRGLVNCSEADRDKDGGATLLSISLLDLTRESPRFRRFTCERVRVREIGARGAVSALVALVRADQMLDSFLQAAICHKTNPKKKMETRVILINLQALLKRGVGITSLAGKTIRESNVDFDDARQRIDGLRALHHPDRVLRASHSHEVQSIPLIRGRIVRIQLDRPTEMLLGDIPVPFRIGDQAQRGVVDEEVEPPCRILRANT